MGRRAGCWLAFRNWRNAVLPQARRMCALLLAAAAIALTSAPARAETNEVRAAQQFGLSYLALMIMEDSKLVEKQAKAGGLGEITVTWAKLGGPGAMNDALLSGGLDF